MSDVIIPLLIIFIAGGIALGWVPILVIMGLVTVVHFLIV